MRYNKNCDMMKKYCNMIKRNCDDIFGETQIYRRKGRLSWIITLRICNRGTKDRGARDTEVKGKEATGHPVNKPRVATAHMASNLRAATANLKGARLTVGDRFPKREERRRGETEAIAPTAENRALA